MKTDKVFSLMTKIRETVDEGNFKADEKIAACRAAAEFYQQVITTESTMVILRETLKNNLEGFEK